MHAKNCNSIGILQVNIKNMGLLVKSQKTDRYIIDLEQSDIMLKQSG